MRNLLYLVLGCLLLTACHVPRFFVRNFANITDHKIFPATPIEAPSESFLFTEAAGTGIAPLTVTANEKTYPLSEYLDEQTRTTAFLVIRNDSILFENYYEGYAPYDISTFFSVSKSITSLLVGITVDDGLIESIDDPVTKYLSELKDADPLFAQQTIRHLLDMRSGFDYTESYGSPFAEMARLYYGTNQRKQLANLKFAHAPGTVHRYQSATTAMLGWIVEEVQGKDLGELMQERVWQPMGMEYDATWSLDDGKHRSAKAYSGVNATARDLAKIGRLYLHGGTWDGKHIVSEEWVRQSTVANFDNDYYQFQWYSAANYLRDSTGAVRIFPDSLAAAEAAAAAADRLTDYRIERRAAGYALNVDTGEFYAQGILGQFLYADKKTNTILVRLGEKYDANYVGIFRNLLQQL